MSPQTPRKPLKVAIVHDWLTNMGGAEPVVLALHRIFPHAPIYTSVYRKDALPAFHDCDVRTTWMQRVIPKKLRYTHILWPVIRSFAFRSLDLSDYDIIISSSSAEAKSVRKTRPDQIHISYIHTPIRYYWSHYEEFKKEFRFGALTPFIRPVIPLFVRWMRRRDLASIKGIDLCIANSTVTQERIQTYYGRKSIVIHPPVATKRFTPPPNTRRSGYIIWGRHVPYKRFDLAIDACNRLGVPLTVIGSGPDTERLKKRAGKTIRFTGRVSDEELVALAHRAKGFLFPNEEDFGIAAVEAMAAGLPIIAYHKGGANDIVEPGETGVFFEHQTVEHLMEALENFESMNFRASTLHRKSKRFDETLFITKMKKVVSNYL